MQDPNFAATFGSQPANEWVWAMNIYDPSGTSSNTYEYEVQITYKVLLFERLPLVQTNVILPTSRKQLFTRDKRNNFKYVSCYEAKCNDDSLSVV